MTYWLYIITLS